MRYRDLHLVVPKELDEVLSRAHDDCIAFLQSKGEPYVSYSDFLIKLLIRGMKSTGVAMEDVAALFPPEETES